MRQQRLRSSPQAKVIIARCLGALMRVAILVAATLTAAPAAFAESGGDLRQAAQNPVSDLISVQFQNNTNFGVGKLDNTQNILNFQPVLPVHLNQDWNLITRPILPVIYQPPFFLGDDTDFGLGDLTPEFFFSPTKPIPLSPGVGLVWGAGPAFQLPTATDFRLGRESGPPVRVLSCFSCLKNQTWSPAS